MFVSGLPWIFVVWQVYKPQFFTWQIERIIEQNWPSLRTQFSTRSSRADYLFSVLVSPKTKPRYLVWQLNENGKFRPDETYYPILNGIGLSDTIDSDLDIALNSTKLNISQFDLKFSPNFGKFIEEISAEEFTLMKLGN